MNCHTTSIERSIRLPPSVVPSAKLEQLNTMLNRNRQNQESWMAELLSYFCRSQKGSTTREKNVGTIGSSSVNRLSYFNVVR
jgi:hypothetical protein